MTTAPDLRGQSGFSLLELLIVLVIMAILVSIAAPALDGYVDRSKTRGALDRIVNDISFARVYAVREGRQVRVTFDGANTRYTIDTLNALGGTGTVRSIALRTDYPELNLSSSVAQLQFDSRGLLRMGGSSENIIRTWIGAARDSMLVSPAGRVYRAQ